MTKCNVRQHDKTDCAAACIASLALHYGHNIPITIIREASGTGQNGTTVKGILDACRKLGFKAQGFKSEDKCTEPLIQLGLPVILHTVNSYGDLHFVVLYSINEKKAVIMDPCDGRLHKITIEELCSQWTGYLVIAAPDPDRSILSSRGTSRLKQYHSIALLAKSDLMLALAGAVIFIVAGISTALFLQRIIDVILPSGDITALARTALLMSVIMVSSLITSYGLNLFSVRASIKIDSRLILKYLEHLFTLPAGFFTQRGAGELNSRVSDAMKVRSFIVQGTTGIVTSILILAVSFMLMFTYYWKMALLTLLFIPAYAILFAAANHINRRVNRRIIESAAAFEEKSVENIASIATLRHYGSSSSAYRNLEQQYALMSGNLYEGGRNAGIFSTYSDAIAKVLTIVLLTIGSIFIFKGEMSVGQLVSFYSLIAYISSPLSQLVGFNDTLTESNIALERLFDIIDLESENQGMMEFPLEKSDDIRFESVSFSYPGCETLLKDFSLKIESGKITAIRGESGCGKSSLAALLMRDYTPDKGKILIGTTDISLIDIEQWRRHISIVPQECSLLSGTILHNIAGNDEKPDIVKTVGILESLGLKQFITELPMGILTRIGERGSRLSGGQKQRIALARALYRDPQILILDEATSSLDKESERYILDRICSLRDEGKTVIMITHKEDNASIADKTVNMIAQS